MWDKITNFFGGNLFGEIKDGIMAYFPPDLTPQERAEMEMGLEKLLMDKQRQADQVVAEAKAEFNQRIKDLEGTAADLKTIPIIGPLVIFLRGLQRPVWGFATLYFDYKWFVEGDNWDEHKSLALIAINVLVLSFLFGERSLKNLLPLIDAILTKYLGIRKG